MFVMFFDTMLRLMVETDIMIHLITYEFGIKSTTKCGRGGSRITTVGWGLEGVGG